MVAPPQQLRYTCLEITAKAVRKDRSSNSLLVFGLEERNDKLAFRCRRRKQAKIANNLLSDHLIHPLARELYFLAR